MSGVLMATNWIELVHDVTGATGRVPNKPSVIAARRAKGWRPVGEKASKPPKKSVVTDGNENTSEEQDRG